MQFLAQKLESETRVLKQDMILFKASSDIGVQRNSGRLGARFAPQAILHAFQKLNQVEWAHNLYECETTSQASEKADFEQSILDSVKILKENFPASACTVHLGGGHDHIYSLLKALYEKGEKNLLILNIDPHCDTRPLDRAHSGNPFRRFQNDCPDWQGRLIQVGISEMNNNKETLAGIPQMDIFNFEQLRVLSENFTKDLELNDFVTQKTIDDCDRVILSLDADIIESSTMEAVSAVSYKGIPAHYLRSFLISLVRDLKKPHTLGVYEYNPIFDNLSNKGSRFLAGLLYDYWKQSLLL